MRRAARRAPPSVYLVVAACVAVIAIMAAPLVFSFLASIKSAAEASASPPHYLPHSFSLQNYLKVVGYQAGLATYVGNSTLVALMTIAACIALAAPAGYGLARFSPYGKEIAFLILLAPMMIPYQALLTPLYLDFAKFGLVNSRLGLAIVHTILQLPFSVYLMRNAFEAIPREIEEAAMIDGCSAARRLTHIFLPLAVPGLVTVALFAFINSWNEFLAALIFMNREISFTSADPAGQRAHRRSRRGRLGRAAGEHRRFDRPLPRRLSRAAALLHFRPAFGRRQMSDCRPTTRRLDGDAAPGARTLRDVARLAGVSIGTASKALNASGRLSAETRAKVLNAAKAIEYRPNDLAQSLHRARSMTVGILSTDSFGRFTFPIVEALERRLFDHGIADLHVQRDRRSGARAPAHRAVARQAGRRPDRHRAARRQARADRAGRARPAGRLRVLVRRRSRRALPAAGRRRRREARRRAISPGSAASASPTSPARSASRRCDCARRVGAQR